MLAGRFDRGELVRVRGRVERFRDELQVEVHADRARRGGRPGRVPARRLPRPGRARRLPRAPRARGPRPRVRGLLERLLGDDGAARRRGGARRARATATTPTSAACSSTPSRSARWRSRPATLHPRLNSDLLICRRARARPRQDARVHLRRRDRALSEEGRLLGHVVLGQRLLDERTAGIEEGQAARARALRALPSRARRGAPGGVSARPQALALYRLNALDATVKGALEHGLNFGEFHRGCPPLSTPRSCGR